MRGEVAARISTAARHYAVHMVLVGYTTSRIDKKAPPHIISHHLINQDLLPIEKTCELQLQHNWEEWGASHTAKNCANLQQN